jgi:2-polyprenyl-3-methyl-5-hydroxy-6-metoxy-1,4-benzoquinol methylase
MILINNLIRNIKDLMTKVRRDGFISAAKAATERARNNPRRWILLRQEPPKYQTTKRVDIEERWDIMSARIPSDAKNALDIGCFQGVITERIAKEGLFTIGLEKDEKRVAQAMRETREVPNCYILKSEVNPKTAEQLPSFDVIFLLTVYYHWVSQYGYENAEEMLQAVVDRANVIFIQTPEDTGFIDSPRLVEEESPAKEVIERYFTTVLDDDFVEYLGTTDYQGGSRNDGIYLIK